MIELKPEAWRHNNTNTSLTKQAIISVNAISERSRPTTEGVKNAGTALQNVQTCALMSGGEIAIQRTLCSTGGRT